MLRSLVGSEMCIRDRVLAVFILEAGLRMAAEWPRVWVYFIDPWNQFDLAVVVVGIVQLLLQALTSSSGGEYFLVLRLVRLVRVLKIFKQVQGLRITALSILSVLPSILWCFGLIGLWFYIYACVGTYCFSANDQKYFDTLLHALIACLSALTWRWTTYFEIAYYGCDVTYSDLEKTEFGCDSDRQAVMAVLFFVSFVLVVSLSLGSLVIGLVISTWSYASVKVQTLTWLESEEEDPGSGGVPAPEVAQQLARTRTVALLKQLTAETTDLQAQAGKFRRMTMYLRPRD
eukprot:TRINITY_DN32179_c0_g1_i1.p1 TRINITY_DN32179_c0_g1~~TRINITY_DN32179_c0_g1_i1.p1  ORF type:complete len:288 (+),score=58.25 TRINITY_DN32179_c0_g1_i1:144-1007(+)